MELTRKQEEGLKIAVERFKNREPWTCIAGYAGTGKSTLVKFIISALQVDPDRVCYIAYTGKAATVLAAKGCPNALTAHKLLYKAVPLPNGKYRFIPRPRDEINFDVIVVDEISMLPKTLWNTLLKHRIYILAMGDPEQLPPVDTNEWNGVLDNPHIFLDEIMRQAQDSEIIRLSMWIRQGNLLETYQAENQQVQIFSKNQIVDGMYDWADQILCATNKTKISINNFIRQQHNRGPIPEVGDKIMSLNNHWDYISNGGLWALTNGTIGEIINFDVYKRPIPYYIAPNTELDYMYTNLLLEDGDKFDAIPIDYNYLLTGEKSLTSRQKYQLTKSKTYEDPPFEFDYAYAITTHKAQGSEWDKVLIFEENFPFPKEDHRRWLYTAITRAKEKVVIIKK